MNIDTRANILLRNIVSHFNLKMIDRKHAVIRRVFANSDLPDGYVMFSDFYMKGDNNEQIPIWTVLDNHNQFKYYIVQNLALPSLEEFINLNFKFFCQLNGEEHQLDPNKIK